MHAEKEEKITSPNNSAVGRRDRKVQSAENLSWTYTPLIKALEGGDEVRGGRREGGCPLPVVTYGALHFGADEGKRKGRWTRRLQ